MYRINDGRGYCSILENNEKESEKEYKITEEYRDGYIQLKIEFYSENNDKALAES